jgi:hypothetical protein
MVTAEYRRDHATRRDDIGTQTEFRPYGPPTTWVADQRVVAEPK